MPPKLDPGRLLYPGFTGRVMVDTWRGVVRVRKWPEKRGRPKSAAVRLQNDWFKEANRLAVRAPGTQMATAIRITRNSGLYPRDILLRMMAGNLGPIPLSDGRVLTKASKRTEPVTWQGTAVELVTPFAVPASTFTPVVWPLPTIDKRGAWSPGAPTRLTIPANVSIVRLWGSISALAGANQLVLHRLWKNGSAIGIVSNNNIALNGSSIHSGAMHVIEGDYFELAAWCSRVSTLTAGGFTNFNLDVLEGT